MVIKSEGVGSLDPHGAGNTGIKLLLFHTVRKINCVLVIHLWRGSVGLLRVCSFLFNTKYLNLGESKVEAHTLT